jgi:hypothetical protein
MVMGFPAAATGEAPRRASAPPVDSRAAVRAAARNNARTDIANPFDVMSVSSHRAAYFKIGGNVVGVRLLKKLQTDDKRMDHPAVPFPMNLIALLIRIVRVRACYEGMVGNMLLEIPQHRRNLVRINVPNSHGDVLH